VQQGGLEDKIPNLLQGEEITMETPDLRRHGMPYERARRDRSAFRLTLFRDGNSEYAEIITPSGGLEIQCLAHTVLRFSTMECGRNTTPTCSKGCARPDGRNEQDSSTYAIPGGLQFK
jgi:hypothetical protein